MVNQNQKKAIDAIKGPILVLAGPGSGKTFVLTNRIHNMVYNHNIDPENILVITFTHKASVEMKERYEALSDSEKVKKDIPKFGTFHSVFYEILRENFGYNQNSLLTEKDREKALVEVLELIKNILQDISSEKRAKEKEEKYKPKYVSKALYDEIRDRYEEKLFNMKKLDFHDMIDVCHKMLSAHKEVLSYYQEKYQYILIDEFQDINKSQYDIVKLICKSKNIFVVGDDDQSIYKFRGSKPSIINDFKKDYPFHKMIALSQNYRCSKSIVRFSKRVIDENKKRVKKDLVSERDENGKIQIKSFVNNKDENDYLIEKIRKKVSLGYDYKDIAILYRTNILAKTLIESLEKCNIPFEVKDYNKSFYDNMVVKDMLSYLKIIDGSTDSEEYINIINKPLRYVSRNAIGYKNTDIDKILSYYRDKNYILKYLIKLKNDIETMKKMHPTLAIRYIRQNIGYDIYLQEICKDKHIDIEEMQNMLNELEEMAIKCQNIKEFLTYVSKEEKNETYVGSFDEDRDAVKLMTFHSSKGLEFKDVIIIDCNDGLIPHKKSIKQNDIETERRLFYVACTRAKDNLDIYFTKERYGKSYEPSRFIKEGLGE
ncbi:MAG: ATP-dependent helicase [Lachnospiraceae bacterium]|nr:ATP-dependent helicase [Lachnospiraceae bacterium]